MKTPTSIHTMALLACLGPAGACNDHPLKDVDPERHEEVPDQISVAANRDVDILFVIDDSASMAEEQATLARNFGPLIERLEAEDVRANYRIAVTTTDVGAFGDTLCGPGPGDEGRFQTSSCLSRPEDFVDPRTGSSVFDEACSSICEHETIEIVPTATLEDPEPRPRPWIENIDGVSNLAGGVTPLEAFQCIAPQGIGGCGLEAPLESMYQALRRTDEDGADELGFVRPGAILAVVFVTDEVDCSSRYDEITDPWDVDGSRALWSEPNRREGRLTSEVCWFAGVDCETQPDGTKECWAADKTDDGDEAVESSDAVLHPLSRYTDLLDRLERAKKEVDPDQELLVAVLTGVPRGYDGGEIRYADGADEDYLRETGIGAGCSSPSGNAAPPVRLAEVARAHRTSDDDVNLFSVCEADYSDAMTAIADAISEQVRPPCVETCVADQDPTVDGLQHDCQLEQEHRGTDGRFVRESIPPCLAHEAGWSIPEGTDACYRSLTEDEMSTECRDEGWNLELAVERRDGKPAPSGARVTARCSVSGLAAVDCPDLSSP